MSSPWQGISHGAGFQPAEIPRLARQSPGFHLKKPRNRPREGLSPDSKLGFLILPFRVSPASRGRAPRREIALASGQFRSNSSAKRSEKSENLIPVVTMFSPRPKRFHLPIYAPKHLINEQLPKCSTKRFYHRLLNCFTKTGNLPKKCLHAASCV